MLGGSSEGGFAAKGVGFALHVLFLERCAQLRSNVVHAGVEGLHHYEAEELARIRHDDAVGIVRIILDGAGEAQAHHFLDERAIEVDAVDLAEVLTRESDLCVCV